MSINDELVKPDMATLEARVTKLEREIAVLLVQLINQGKLKFPLTQDQLGQAVLQKGLSVQQATPAGIAQGVGYAFQQATAQAQQNQMMGGLIDTASIVRGKLLREMTDDELHQLHRQLTLELPDDPDLEHNSSHRAIFEEIGLVEIELGQREF